MQVGAPHQYPAILPSAGKENPGTATPKSPVKRGRPKKQAAVSTGLESPPAKKLRV